MEFFLYFFVYIIFFILLTVRTIKDNRNAYMKYDLDGAKLRLKRLKKFLIIQIIISISIISFSIYRVDKENNNSCMDLNRYRENEIDIINEKFEKYKGSQTDTAVKGLIDTLIANVRANAELKERIPTVKASGFANNQKAIGNQNMRECVDDYRGDLTTIRDALERSHKYEVILKYNEIGFVNEIIIKY